MMETGAKYERFHLNQFTARSQVTWINNNRNRPNNTLHGRLFACFIYFEIPRDFINLISLFIFLFLSTSAHEIKWDIHFFFFLWNLLVRISVKMRPPWPASPGIMACNHYFYHFRCVVEGEREREKKNNFVPDREKHIHQICAHRENKQFSFQLQSNSVLFDFIFISLYPTHPHRYTK